MAPRGYKTPYKYPAPRSLPIFGKIHRSHAPELAVGSHRSSPPQKLSAGRSRRVGRGAPNRAHRARPEAQLRRAIVGAPPLAEVAPVAVNATKLTAFVRLFLWSVRRLPGPSVAVVRITTKPPVAIVFKSGRPDSVLRLSGVRSGSELSVRVL